MNRIQAVLEKVKAAPFHVQLRRLRWIAPLVVLVLAAVHQALLHWLADPLPAPWHDLAELLLYALTGSAVTVVGLSWIVDGAARRAEAEDQLRTAYAQLDTNHQKLRALHDLGERLAAADDEQAVLELAAQAPLQLTSARASTVVSFDNERNRLKLDMAWGLSDNYLSALRARIDAGIPAQRCRNCIPLKTKSNSDCPLFVGLHAAARAEGIGSLVCLPMARDQERLGIMAAYFPSPDGPPEDQIRLLNILSGSIAALLESLRARTREVGALHAIDRTLAGTDPLNDFAAQVLEIAISGWEAHAGGLFLYEPATSTWTCRAGRGLGDALTDSRFDFALQLAGQTYLSGAPRVIPEIEATLHTDWLSAAAAPLITEGHTLGAIVLGAQRQRVFSEHHIELLATMAHQIALAIRNTQLYTQLGEMAIYEERYRLSREIHDGLAQTLAYLSLQTERLEKLLASGRQEAATVELAEMRQSLRAAYVDAREAIDGLRLGIDNPDQLAIRLAEYTRDFSRQTEVAAHFAAEPEDLTCDPAVAVQLLRIAQEALTNVRKHAQARRIDVRLSARVNEIELNITDDGCGFPALSPSTQTFRRHGLASMRERAQSLGGALTIATGVTQGTRITATIPVRGNHR